MKKTFKHPKFTAVFTDENGYFSLTGSINGSSGAVADEIAKEYPEFELVAKYHLANCKTGEPMHAWPNSEYHAKQTDLKAIEKTLNCTQEEAKTFWTIQGEKSRLSARVEYLTPYRKYKCGNPILPLAQKATLGGRNKQAVCSQEWIAPVKFAESTQGLSGEKKAFCPKCHRPARISSPWCDKSGETWEYGRMEAWKNSFQDIKEALLDTLNKEFEFKIDLKEQWEEEAKEVYEIIEDTEANLVGKFIDPYTDEGDFIAPEYEAHLDGMDEPEKAIAAAMQEDIDVLEVTEDRNGTYTAAGIEYMVLTDDEADQLWDEDLENCIDEYLEIPENIKVYFDREEWKKDARQDGRGHSLGRYDGHEYYQDVNGTTYYLYRQ